MAEYYHVSVIDHLIGTVIQPGRAGAQYRQYVSFGDVVPKTHDEAYRLTWETALETARRLSAPDRPSRLNCVYAFTTLQAAKVFRDKFRAGLPIFKIEADDDLPTFLGDIDSISNAVAGQPMIDYWIEGAVKYWKEQPPGVAEILIGGPVKIVEKVG